MTKLGYKKTELGWIPNEWEIGKFKDLCTLNQGLQIPIENRYKISGANRYVYLTIQYLNNKSDIEYIENPQKSVICTKEDILMSRTGNSGIIITGVEGVFHNNFFRINYFKQYLNRVYLIYILQTERLQYLLRVYAGTSTIPDLNHGDFKSLKIPLPPLPEQKKIAEILSTWDKAIESTEKLLEVKTKLKQGLMQKMLTGKLRFKEFEGEKWKEFKLGEVFSERLETGYINLKLIAITGKNGIVDRDDIDKADTSNEDKSKYKRILKGDIGYNTMRMWQGVSGYSNFEGIVSPAYTVIIPKKNVDGLYMSYLFKTKHMIYTFWRYSQGLVDDTLNCKYHNFALVKAYLPIKDEQQKIAHTLNKLDKENEILSKQLEALKEQKKGLMQKLLTGEVRVKV